MSKPFTLFICTECGQGDQPCKHWEKEETDRRFMWIEAALCEIVHLVKNIQREEKEEAILIAEVLAAVNFGRPTGAIINQIDSGTRIESMSTPAGGTSVFQIAGTPPGSVFPVGTTYTYTVDDTADISLSPSPDGDLTKIQATCVAIPTGTNYNLTCTTNFTPPGAASPIAPVLNVPIVPATPPTPTGAVINQLS